MNDGGPGRRRSVDVGGLALALSQDGLGYGWGGWEETENGETKYVTFHSWPVSLSRTRQMDKLRLEYQDFDISNSCFFDTFRYAEVLIDVRAHTETILNHDPQDE